MLYSSTELGSSVGGLLSDLVLVQALQASAMRSVLSAQQITSIVSRHGLFPRQPSTRRRIHCSADIDEQEARLAALEDAARKGKKFEPMKAAMGRVEEEDTSGRVVWKEGSLLPEGFDKMDPLEKAGQLWTGERGLLFWLNKAAYASLFIIVGGWVLFRFVGPALGLYELSNALPVGP